MPTLLSQLHYDKPYVAFGKDLFHPSANDFAINYLDGNYQIFTNNYVLKNDGKKVAGLYDYKADRMLKHKLENPNIQNDLLQKTKAFEQQYNNRMIDNTLMEVK